jgi:hypothetical protein
MSISDDFGSRFREFAAAEALVPSIFTAEHGFQTYRLDRPIKQNPDFLVYHPKAKAIFAVEVKVSTTPVFFDTKSRQIEEQYGEYIRPRDLLLFDAKHVRHYKKYTAEHNVPVFVLYIATWQPDLVFFDDLAELRLYETGHSSAGQKSIRGTQTEKVYADARQMRTLEEGLAHIGRELGCPDLSELSAAFIHENALSLDCLKQITYPADLPGAAEIAERLANQQHLDHLGNYDLSDPDARDIHIWQAIPDHES